MPDYDPINNEDSLELASLASSEQIESGSVSLRDLTPINSHEFSDNDDGALLRGADENAQAAGPGHTRNLSNSSIGSRLFDLATSRERRVSATLEKIKSLSLIHGVSLVVSIQVGSGIFSSPGQVDSSAGSVGSSLLVWLVGGMLAWTGASSYAELGTAIPLNGSSQAYLNYIFGPIPSFLFSWTALTALKPGGCAIIAIICGEYISVGTGIGGKDSTWINKGIALAALLAVSALNALSTKSGANASSVFFALKVGLLIAISVIGFAQMYRFRESSALLTEGLFEGASTNLGSYAIALYASLWAFDGWDNMNYLSAEMRNPGRDLPRTIHMSMPLVIFFYLLTNVAYYSVLSRTEISSTSTIALDFGYKVGGWINRLIFSLLIACSCVGALNATVFSSSRLVHSAANENFLPKFFAKINRKTEAPINAILLNSGLTALFILVGQFNSLLTFYGVANYLFYFLTVLGLIILRFKEPDLPRPYRTRLMTPIIFCCVALFLVSRSIFERPWEAGAAVAFIVAGLPLYFWRFGFKFK